MKKTTKLIIFSSAFILLLLVIKKLTGRKYKSLTDLNPAIRKSAYRFMQQAKAAGYPFKITSAYRSWDEQERLYNQGRTTPGQIVTNARPGQSLHNYGLAFDVLGEGENYNTTNWEAIAQIGKANGFEWGGDWAGLIDKPHFQKTFGYSISQLKSMYESGQVDSDGFVKIPVA